MNITELDYLVRPFCKDHDIEYDPINDDLFFVWQSSKFQSK